MDTITIGPHGVHAVNNGLPTQWYTRAILKRLVIYFVIGMYVCTARTSVALTRVGEQTCVMLRQARRPDLTLCA